MLSAGYFGGVVLVIAIALASAMFRVLREYERGVVFMLGRFYKVKGPGLIIVIPVLQQMVRVDLRTIVMDVPTQDVISRDNVSVKVNAVLYFRVVDPERAIIQVENFLKHQHPHRDEKSSTIPAPCLHHASTMQNGLIPDSLLLIPDPCSSKLQPRTTSETETDPDGDAPAPVPPPPPASETPPAEKTTTLPPATPIADAVTVRAVSIAVLLRQRGAGVAAGDPRLRSWAERGIGDAALLLALETAESRRAQSGSLHPVNAGLLDAILGDVHAPPSRASPHGRQGERERYAASAAASQQRLKINTGANLERIEHDITGQSASLA